FDRLHNRKIGRLFAFKNTARINTSLAKRVRSVGAVAYQSAIHHKVAPGVLLAIRSSTIDAIKSRGRLPVRAADHIDPLRSDMRAPGCGLRNSRFRPTLCGNPARSCGNCAADAPLRYPTTGTAGSCCASAVTGHVAATPVRTVTKSRRLMIVLAVWARMVRNQPSTREEPGVEPGPMSALSLKGGIDR